MTSRRDAQALAREFWSSAKVGTEFPRKIEQAVAAILPLAIVKIPLLNTSAIATWLRSRRAPAHLPVDRRNLRGCLVAHRGHGLVFVWGHDEPSEQRLTVAHETAHFLVDYLLPRRKITDALGERITEVLDGDRVATTSERAHAVLSHVRLGAHVHLLPKHGTDQDLDPLVAAAEHRAERLALELVAPQERIKSLLGDLPGLTMSAAGPRLAAFFGVPAYAFESILRPNVAPPVSFLQGARLSLRAKSYDGSEQR